MRCLCILAFALVGLSLTAGESLAKERRFAMVVGYNDSDDANLKKLRYADDDALRNARLLDHVTDKLILLTQLDKESQRLFGPQSMGSPTRANIIAGLKKLRAAMDDARAAGDQPILYFAYSGHGNYDAEGRGYIHLADGRFTTRDLYFHLFEPAKTDPIILMVDACNAALLVNSRGVVTRRRVTSEKKLNLENYPNVGVVLASSTVGETHEWGRYLAGVFSHEVRSGLLGPADLNGDEKVTFIELAAFIAAANDRVANPTVRVKAYIRPPLSHPNLALIDIGQGTFPAKLRIQRSFKGKAHVVDSDLIRYADFHKGPSQEFTLALTNKDSFVLVQGEDEFVIPKGTQGTVEVGNLQRRKRTVLSARGAGSDYFERTLFHRKYDAGYASTYLSQDYLMGLKVQRFNLDPWYENENGWLALAAGIGSIGAAAVFHAAAFNAAEEGEQATWADQRHLANQRADRNQTTANILYGLGGAAALTSALLFALDRNVTAETYEPPLRLNIGPTGISLQTKL
tara:strand:+ start:410 stop:1954 length:1545 start_codon:yes stop_codon:yes gene_type:complete